MIDPQDMVEKQKLSLLCGFYRQTKTSNLCCVFFSFTAEQFGDKNIYININYVNNKEAIARSCDQSDGNGRSQIAKEIISFVRVMEDT